MTKVIDLAFPLLTVNAFCGEAAADHATISRRLKTAGIAPAGARGKHRLFRLADLLRVAFVVDANGCVDPDRLDPFRRNAHWKSEREKLRVETERGELIPRLDVEQEQARLAKIVVKYLELLPDILERDYGISGPVIKRIEDDIDGLRLEIYQDLMRPVT